MRQDDRQVGALLCIPMIYYIIRIGLVTHDWIASHLEVRSMSNDHKLDKALDEFRVAVDQQVDERITSKYVEEKLAALKADVDPPVTKPED